jgi:hypothetical protein
VAFVGLLVGPARRSSTRIQLTACVAAMLWPKRAMQSAWSMSASVAGCPSQPNVSFSASAAVAVHRRVLPSTWLVPIPARQIVTSV